MREGWRSWGACTAGQAEPFHDTSGALPHLASGCTSTNRIGSKRPRLAVRNSDSVKSISDIKANAAEVLDRLKKDRTALLITQNGEACAMLQNVKSFEYIQQTMKLLNALTAGQRAAYGASCRPVASASTSRRCSNPTGLYTRRGNSPASQSSSSSSPTAEHARSQDPTFEVGASRAF